MRLTALIAGLILAGCATSPVTPLDEGNYAVTVNSLFGTGSRSRMMDRATEEATDFCAQRGQIAQIRNANETGVMAVTPLSTQIIFKCAPPGQ